MIRWNVADDDAFREETRRWVMTPSDREIHLRRSIEQKMV